MPAPRSDLSRYRGPLPFIVEWEDVASAAEAPAANPANRGKCFLVSVLRTLDPAFADSGATPGALAQVNLDAYGAPYVFRAAVLGDVVCRPDGSLLRFSEVRRPDPATGANVTTVEWVPYRTPPQRALDGMQVFDLFDPDRVYDYYARLVGAVLGQLQVTNRDLAKWRDPKDVPAEYLELAAASIGAKFYPGDSERLRRNKIEAAVPASRFRGSDRSYDLKLRQLGYQGFVTESWQRQSMIDWFLPARGRLPLYQQASIVFSSNQNPSNGDFISVQVTELAGAPSAYMLAPVLLVFDGHVLREAQGATVADATQTGTLARTPVRPGAVTIRISAGGISYVLQDDGGGAITGDANGTVDYATGAWSATFASALPAGGAMAADYFLASVPYPRVLIGVTVRETLANLAAMIGTIPALALYVDAGVYPDASPHLLLQSKRLFTEPGNPTLRVGSSVSAVTVVTPSPPDGAWNPPSRAIDWPAIHVARLVNDAQLAVRAFRTGDGTDLFPYVTAVAAPGNAYRRSRLSVVFYNQYVPQPGDAVEVVIGGATHTFIYGTTWPSVPDTGVLYDDSHAAAETLFAAMSAAFGGGATVQRAPVGFAVAVGVGETGAGYVDPTAAWLELPHGSRDEEVAAHAMTNLLSIHVAAADGTPLNLDAIPSPNVANGGDGPVPAMDPVRQRILGELVEDVMPANARVRAWYAVHRLPNFTGESAEAVLVGDTLSPVPPTLLITQTGDTLITQTGDEFYVYA